MVTKPWFRKLYRTDAAEQIFIYFIGGIEHFAPITGFSRNVRGGVNDKDQVVLAIVVRFDNPVVECIQKRIIGQLAGTKFQEKILSSSRIFRREREFHVEQIFSNRAGQCLAK